MKPWNIALLSILMTLTGYLNLVADENTYHKPEEYILSELKRNTTIISNPSDLLLKGVEERRVAFQNVSELFPARNIKKSSTPLILEKNTADFSDFTYSVEGQHFTLNDFFQMPSHVGLIVVQGNKILLEHYAPDVDSSTQWVSFSVTKSITSMLIGAAIKDGLINDVNDPISRYLPAYLGTAYENVSIKNLLQMTSGVNWNENYEDPESDVMLAGALSGLELADYLTNKKKVSSPGNVYNYNTAETTLVGEILIEAINKTASEYLEDKIWKPFGMESDATWILNKSNGNEIGGCCLSAVLRDYARIGLFALNNGQLTDGTEILPKRWISESTQSSKAYKWYGYAWFIGDNDNYSAEGIFDQQIFINPNSNLVIAAQSNSPTANDSIFSHHLIQLTEALNKKFSNNEK